MRTAVLPASKVGHGCLTILIQSFNDSINAHFQIESLAKVELKVVPVTLVCLSSSRVLLLGRVRCELFIYTVGASPVLLLQVDGRKFLVNYI